MPGFAAPGWLLILPPILAIIYWLGRREPTGVLFSDLSLVDHLPRGRAGIADAARRWLRTIAIVAAIVVLAGPRIPDRRTRLPAEGIAIVFAIDVSGSMGEKDFPSGRDGILTTRLVAAKETTVRFVQGGEDDSGVSLAGRKTDSLGLVSFAAWPDPICPITLNHSVLIATLEKLSPKSGVDAGTNIGDAIAEGLIRLEAAGNRRKVLILLTDGEHNISLNRSDPPLKPRQAAQLAHDLKIPIYTIDCGGNPIGDAEAVQRRIEGQRTLQAIADMTGGRMFVANDRADLQTVYGEIDQIERSTTESFTYRRYRDWSPWFAGLALAAALIQIALDKIFWRILSNGTT